MQPLDGIRVVTLATNLPGPLAAGRLRQMGADIIKVEPPGGDLLEKLRQDWYASLNAGQKIIRLDLKTQRSRKRLDHILKDTDVLMTASRAGALNRLSLGWKELHAKYPRLCHVALMGARTENIPGHDLTYLASCGLVSPPAMPATLYADMASSERLVSCALALLMLRNRSNVGRYARVVMTDVARDFAEPRYRGLTTASGLLGGTSPFYNLYKTRAGWIALAALESHFQKRLLEELHLMSADHNKLTSVFATRRADYWHLWASKRDIPLVKVRTN